MLEKNVLISEAENAINWIKEFVNNSNSKGVVVGNSGGKDSATVIAMATKALGKENVLTVAMPCNSIEDDLNDAKLVSKTYDVRFLEVNLTNTYNELENSINNSLNNIGKELILESKIWGALKNVKR